MDTKHTPGPWVMKLLPSNGNFTVEGPSRNGPDSETNRPWIADTGDSAYIQRDEREANARLISAAPELLAALEETNAALLQYLTGVGSKKDARNRYEIGCAAIAKATTPNT